MGLLEAGRWFALSWLVISVPVSLVAGRLLARNNARYPLVRSPRPGERVATVHQLRPRRRATFGRAAAVGATCAAVVFSAVGTAAALGGLPSQAQSATASVIEALSPFSVPRATVSPTAAARSRAAAARRATSTGRGPVPAQPGGPATQGGLPAPAPGIAVPTAAPDDPPSSTPPDAPLAVPPSAVPTQSGGDPVAPTETPSGSPGPTEPAPTEAPSPTGIPTTAPPIPDPSPTDLPTADPSPSQTASDSPSPTPLEPAGTPTPEPSTTVTPVPNPTP